jgi:hypothetical protein
MKNGPYAEYNRRRRAAAKAEGMCQYCLKRTAMPDKVCCGYCEEQKAEYKAKRKAVAA